MPAPLFLLLGGTKFDREATSGYFQGLDLCLASPLMSGWRMDKGGGRSKSRGWPRSADDHGTTGKNGKN